MTTFVRIVLGLQFVLLPGSVALAQNGPRANDRETTNTILKELKSIPHKILFETYVKNNWEIFLMNADGSGQQNLTNSNDEHELYPQAAPDGTKICYLRDTQEKGRTVRNVYVMNADGTGRTLVAERARQPCWSSDSKGIAFVKQEFNRFSIKDYASKGLFFYDLATGVIKPHRNNDSPDPKKRIHHLYNLTWSKDGEWIVSTVHAGMGFGHAIIAIEVNGDRVIDLGLAGCRPTISPDGKHVTWSPDDHTISIAEIDFSASQPRVMAARVLEKQEKSHT